MGQRWAALGPWVTAFGIRLGGTAIRTNLPVALLARPGGRARSPGAGHLATSLSLTIPIHVQWGQAYPSHRMRKGKQNSSQVPGFQDNLKNQPILLSLGSQQDLRKGQPHTRGHPRQQKSVGGDRTDPWHAKVLATAELDKSGAGSSFRPPSGQNPQRANWCLLTEHSFAGTTVAPEPPSAPHCPLPQVPHQPPPRLGSAHTRLLLLTEVQFTEHQIHYFNDFKVYSHSAAIVYSASCAPITSI